jgi:subtilisin family serine protease
MKRLKEMKGLVLLAFAVTAGMALWGTAASASGSAGGPLAQSATAATQHIALSKASGAKPRSLKGVPAKGNYAFLLKLDVQSTGLAYNANLPRGRSAARVAAADQLATVRSAQSRVIAALPSGSHVLYQTHAVLAGVAVYTNVKNLSTLERISGVSRVYGIAPKKPSLSYSIELEHGPQAWQNFGTGAGSSIAVIDTGVDYTHADFGGSGDPADYQTALANDTAAPTYPDPNKISTESFDFAGDAYDATPTDPGFDPTPAPDPNPLDCNSHGTHTAGDAAGYGENPDGSKFIGDYTTLGSLSGSAYQATFKIGPGMAPEAKIYSYKVFGCEGSTNVVGEAIDRAADPNNDGSTADHVDVISMSLGSDYGSPQDGDSVTSNAASALGISVVAAAGNGGDLYDVGGSPGNAQSVIGVAASADAYSQLDTLHVSAPAGDAGAYPAERSVAYDWANDPDFSTTAPVVTLTDPGDADNQDGCDPISTDLTGKIAWLEWTDNDANRRCGSVARSANAEAAGAVGAVFADDEDSFAAGITGSATIPVVMVTKTAGDTLRPDAVAGTLRIGSTSANDFEQDLPALDDEVAGFSSRGIRIAGDVKPDVSAVGVSVFSAGMGTGDDGLSDSGTSMATPEVAGLDALVRDNNSSWSPEEVKADIMNTAGQDLFTGGNHTGTKFAPNRVGAGRIDAQAALANNVLAYVNDDPGAVSASFGTIEATGPMTLHKTINVVNKDLVNPSATYDVTYDALTQVPGATYSVSPSTVTLAAGETKTVTLTLTIDSTKLTKTIDPTIDPAPDGLPGEFLADASGRVLLTAETAGPPTLRVPVYSAPRPASVMTQPASLDMPTGAIQTKSLPLSGTGVDQGTGSEAIQSLVSGFELQAKSPALTGIPSDEKAADLKYVGTTSDAPELASIGDTHVLDDGEVYFAISTQGPWHTAASQNEYDIYIDSDGDGVPDVVVFNTRLSDSDNVFVAEVFDLNLGEVVDAALINDRFADTDTALFDSDTLVMPVFIDDLPGVTAGHSRITYGVVTFGQFSGSPVDSVGFDNNSDLDGALSTDVLNPGVAVFGDVNASAGNSLLLYRDMPGTSLTVRRDAAAYAADHGMGAMLVHFHNAAGNKAQIVDIDHHSVTVTKSGTGTGTVTSSPAGIDCGSTCTAAFNTGASVTLTATADSGSSFTGWSGGGCSGTGTCQVTLNADTAVTATFAKNAAKDKTPPKVKGLKVKLNHKKRTAKVTFHGTDPGHGSKGLHFKCKLDKKRFKSCRSGIVYKHLHRGKHTVQVKAIDKAGNVSKPAKRKFKV